MKQQTSLVMIFSGLIIFALLSCAVVIAMIVLSNRPLDDVRACTLEAKLCPDGSAVGRQGPNCEFAKCPGEK